MSETTIMREIRQAVCLARREDGTYRARLFRNHVGMHPDVGRFGLGTGTADLVGFLLDSRGQIGRLFCIEVKTKIGKASKEQLLAQRWLRVRGAHSSIARSVTEAMAALERAEKGETS